MKIICDIDGTVADNSHREGFIQNGNKDWDKFYDPVLIAQDKPIEKAVRTIKHILAKTPNYYDFMYLTGRPERTREATREWLLNNGILASLHMRSDVDKQPAVKFKENFVNKYGFQMLFIDDDPRNEAMYWKYGVPLHAPDCWDNFMIGKVDVWPKEK